MQLFSATPRGVWRAFIAIWLLGCVPLWMITPIRLQASWPLAEHEVPIAFGPDGNSVLTETQIRSFVESHGWREIYGTVSLCDHQTGILIRTLIPNRHDDTPIILSPDRRWLIHTLQTAEKPSFDLIDTTTGHTVATLPIQHHDQNSPLPVCFSRDGHTMAFGRPCNTEREFIGEDGPEIVLWDLTSHSVRTVLPGLRFPAALSENGRSVAAVTANRNAEQVRVLGRVWRIMWR